jgi:hypothetical protein
VESVLFMSVLGMDMKFSFVGLGFLICATSFGSVIVNVLLKFLSYSIWRAASGQIERGW